MRLANADETEAAGALLGAHVMVGDVIALSGPLGAGKTCFTRGLLRALGFAGDVPSPTFGIVIPYDPPDVRVPIWHVDLYRIDNPEDIDELGLDDALTDTALVIEWPGRMGCALWPGSLRIDLSLEGSGRRLTATVPPSWEARWPFR
jgi:tRNA threonylcarbamoyladenosine biosynthesis protein TsaE